MIPASSSRRHRVVRRLGAVLLVCGLFVALAAVAAPAQPAGELVDVVEVEGIIDQTISDYLVERIEHAEADGAEAVVVSLDTPGGLGVSMDRIVDAITTSSVPVAVWVGPSGARAASAGMYIAYASHVLAMAPATTMGAAAPVDLGGGDLDAEVRNTAEGQLLALAEMHGRDVDFARRAVRDGAVVAIGEVDSLPADARLPAGIEPGDVTIVSSGDLGSMPVADLVAESLPDLLTALDGRDVRLMAADGTPTTATIAIDQASANVRFNNLGLVRRVLHTVASPTLAYLLLIAGALALLFEIFQPGFGVSGVTGIVLIGLALYGVSVLPVNWLALGLIVLGLVLLAADLAIAGLGPLTGGGTIALTVGSFLLFSGSHALRLPPWLIGAVVLFNLFFFVVIMTTVLRAQGTQPMLGAEGLEGTVGVVRSVLNPEGRIFVNGALWRGRVPEDAGRVKAGTRVRVLGVDEHMTLQVEIVGTDEDADDQAPVG
ncbi:MAG: hypothetical protein GEU74_00625 [Nitriliruptorales bacterium]|nr:hypothetical protein [Nitriliruptorales bacterium]